jgi:hypothetical protein
MPKTLSRVAYEHYNTLKNTLKVKELVIEFVDSAGNGQGFAVDMNIGISKEEVARKLIELSQEITKQKD